MPIIIGMVDIRPTYGLLAVYIFELLLILSNADSITVIIKRICIWICFQTSPVNAYYVFESNRLVHR